MNYPVIAFFNKQRVVNLSLKCQKTLPKSQFTFEENFISNLTNNLFNF